MNARRFGWLGLCLFLILAVPQARGQTKVSPPDRPPEPIRGTLVIVGGGKIPDSVVKAFVQAAGGAKANLVVIPTASQLADKETEKSTIELWQKRGFPKVSVLHTRSRAQANDPDFAKTLKLATAVWLGGGDQKRLTEAYKSTLVEKELHELLRRGGAIGGTSAGAAVMSKLMIAGGNAPANLAEGFGFFPGGVIDQHFLKRNRVDRLLDVLHRQPGWFGLGIDEGTAAVVHGETITIIGDSLAMICQRSTAERPASCRVLRAGEKADLVELFRSALQRTEKSPGK